jgi:hypothetical protein
VASEENPSPETTGLAENPDCGLHVVPWPQPAGEGDATMGPDIPYNYVSDKEELDWPYLSTSSGSARGEIKASED